MKTVVMVSLRWWRRAPLDPPPPSPLAACPSLMPGPHEHRGRPGHDRAGRGGGLGGCARGWRDGQTHMEQKTSLTELRRANFHILSLGAPEYVASTRD
ncbi:hypothetical protein E2C01_068015 [Portunus trituberculatus]|uniref:Uncharacterized protein n=1 Tax=Portunus trituberculatus TaxID=210409 RepID=A0A5B7HV96_PORTR|nr:hypothetical protein [Portunus trituberculatus]